MEQELQLVERARAGDTEAFARLYEQVYQDMYRFALYILKDHHDAQDVVSDTVADAFAAMGKLREASAFRGWIFKILTNKCKRKLKEYVDRPGELTEDMPEQTSRRGMDEHAAVRSLFFSLAEEERIIIAMHLFGGYSSREMASMLHMNENTIRSKESRALKKMAQSYWD